MKKLITMVPDALILSGAGALSHGAGLLHPAAGFIMAGILLLVGGVSAARRAPVEKDEA
ncbi:hypothetical protein [Herbaspirillum sp. SJZ107]|uniref:hypothetical protein n=1 Tax=Herbaspirillum sp. SJZ107 TaxID=2572881 RepID=UPI00116ADAC2|nr:hypothetical protein [Herbaspirillum sp. SJZ107]TQK10240.1 hypothetical protein FBX97_0156 [Herbaspirillum sp. SJZ107]